jgi:tripartite-type tricarboxylate transporter receptor subunit TctC
MFTRPLLLAAAASIAAPLSAAASDWPERSVRFVHGFAAGGNADVISRVIGEELSAGLGQPFVVEPRPGAGGNIASDFTAKANPDGYTIQLLVGGHTVSGALYENLAFDPVGDFAFVSAVSRFPFFVVTRADHAFDSIEAVIEHARANPGMVTYGSAGIGTTQHLTGELLAVEAGVEMTHIPYGGGAAAVTALLGGEIDLVIDAITPFAGQLSAGTLRFLAATSADRWGDLPDVPTVAETVAPGFDVISWTGVGTTAGVDPAIVERLNAEVHRALGVAEVQERLRALGSEPWMTTPEELTEFVRGQIDDWNRVIDAAGIPRQ